ncbi:phosphoserine transaminase [Commensalibacter nepenthis]|uniref:phosphoserine transaminase n=1 Tax=Commensalibacter nepenthis TaxID=3043872 RepID=A0ABT6Q8M4_9PROT|nr:phosphoserine transaminase [Commensalibacter sp. TBRC 10068]MDI2113260.1 phosphoserine transaminase [Commensalibacter sp. TBRC 10068]
MSMTISNIPPKPHQKPNNPCFSSGPCAKRPGWNLDVLQDALVGRSHRSTEGRQKLKDVIDLSADILGIPQDWKVGIIPASDTGAVELALWALLGSRPVEMVSFDSFSAEWVTDVVKQLKLPEATIHQADYGDLPDLNKINWDHDVVMVWNGTTSGVKIPNDDFIPQHHDGLIICDATSAAFAMDLPWFKLDIVTWSWQKALGGEAAHGMIALSPNAVKRLEETEQLRPLPKIFRLLKQGKLNDKIFEGDTINTPSMLCVEDALDGLRWAQSVGGLQGLKKRCDQSLALIAQWVAQTPWVEFLASKKELRSNTSICLKIVDPWFVGLNDTEQKIAFSKIIKHLADEKAGYDLASYRDAPLGLRIWGGATVESSDIELLLPWLDWAFALVKSTY